MFHLNFNLNSYIKVRTALNRDFNTFLLDTGADVSLIKIDKIENFEGLNESYTTNISGIGSELVRSCGKIDTDIRINKYLIQHDFHIVPNDFPIPYDGIIGLDLIKKI